ncbi:hypothetical protein E4631_24005 [Hymenobacter sp. UV11]|uniref:hypothetical protein n=1 Tax=Hymenobacter sp. UV11 TaxID=1849735 RepID=UPI00105F1D30|nr:hypothetical protein [Hymenobacter sp. UV11]TDN38617.1 hypothetical protein A8B98_23000 [Hymenobacter sp. UV11]TFZ62995.1 hypothetical protein E4631_24005 [Hymenobacter sp. UV11]
MTKADLYALIDQYIKVNPLVVSIDKTRGTDVRELLKSMLDFTEQNTGAAFNGERPITAPIPGLQGITLHGTTEKDVLHNLLLQLYPALPPLAAMSVANPVRERGDASAVGFNWTATPQSNPITTIKVNGKAVKATGNQQSGSGSLPADALVPFTIVVSDGTLSASAGASVNYYPARFFGPSANDRDHMVAALTNGTPIDYAGLGLRKELAGDYLINTTSDCTGGRYIHLLFDAAYGAPSLVRSGINNFSAYILTDVIITDAFGIARDYKLLSTGIQFGGAVNIAIIS